MLIVSLTMEVVVLNLKMTRNSRFSNPYLKAYKNWGIMIVILAPIKRITFIKLLASMNSVQITTIQITQLIKDTASIRSNHNLKSVENPSAESII